MADAEKAVIVRWLVENVFAYDVPSDEGSDDGLLWNLVNLAIHGRDYKRYDYSDEQDRQVAEWRAGKLPIDVDPELINAELLAVCERLKSLASKPYGLATAEEWKELMGDIDQAIAKAKDSS
jgi:hypothetical protein